MLPMQAFWFTLNDLPQWAARFPPAPSTRYQETKQVRRFIEFSGGRLSLLALILLNIHPLSFAFAVCPILRDEFGQEALCIDIHGSVCYEFRECLSIFRVAFYWDR
jgi:hypothetical protein